MKVKIVSDGTVAGTKALLVEDGREEFIERVTAINWSIDLTTSEATAVLTIGRVEIDGSAEAVIR